MENAFKRLFVIAFRSPVTLQTLVGEQRIVGAEHHTITQPTRNIVLQISSEIFRRPAVQLVPDIALVHQYRQCLGLPRPTWTRGNNRHLRKFCGNPIQVARMAVVENNAVAARQTSTQSSGADEYQSRDSRFGTQLVKRKPLRI